MSTAPQPNQRSMRPPPSQPRAATRADGQMEPQRDNPTIIVSTSTPTADNDFVTLIGLINRATEIAARMTLEGKLRTTQRQLTEAAARIQVELSKAKNLENKHKTQVLNLQTRIQELIASNAAKEEMIKSQASKIESMQTRLEQTRLEQRPTQLLDLEMHVQESAAHDVGIQDIIRSHAAKIESLEAGGRGRQCSLIGGINWSWFLQYLVHQAVIELLCAYSPQYQAMKSTMEWLFLGLFISSTSA